MDRVFGRDSSPENTCFHFLVSTLTSFFYQFRIWYSTKYESRENLKRLTPTSTAATIRLHSVLVYVCK